MNHKVSDNSSLTNSSQPESIEDSGLEIVSIDEGDISDSAIESESEDIVLERMDQNPYEVSYTCLLLPRLSSHYLLGDVADQLQSILEQISTSFGWRLEFLSVKPEYLQWAIRVPPSTSTTYVMQVVRTQTSQQIFADYPRFKHENQSDDFWAPGYLIFWGSQPHPVEIIQRYIFQTRRQQGVSLDE
jgi:REP element-mobilizing transposase RayT